MASVILCSSIFGKREICLTSVTEVPLPQQMLLTWVPFSVICFATGYPWNSSTTVLLKQYCFLYTHLHVRSQIREAWVQILSHMYCSPALCTQGGYLTSSLSKNTNNNLFHSALHCAWPRGAFNKWVLFSPHFKHNNSWHLLSTYHMPGTALSASYKLTPLTLTTT